MFLFLLDKYFTVASLNTMNLSSTFFVTTTFFQNELQVYIPIGDFWFSSVTSFPTLVAYFLIDT